MIRVTVPRPVAEALMPRPCPHVDCEGEGDAHCWGCHGSGSLPPTLNLLVVEGYWPPGFVTDDDHPPTLHPEHARAIEAGERIGIDVECDRCNGRGQTADDHDGTRWNWQPCLDCTDGRVLVGSVRPTKVMPITDDDNDDCPGVPHLFVQSEAPFDDGHQVFGCGYSPCDVSESLAVYGPAESLLGKFAVEVEDARRGE